MALNNTLGLVRAMFKAEAAKSLASATTAQDAEINQIICDRQQWLASIYDWPFLEERWDMNISVNQRYVNFPTVDNVGVTVSVDFQRPWKLEIKWNQVWQPVLYGVGSDEYNYIDSDTGQVLDPVQRFRYEGTSKMEIWPVPAGQQTLRITGQRICTSLITGNTTPPTWNDSATVDLDDLMVSLFAVSYYLGREKQNNSKLVFDTAMNRMNEIRAIYPKRERETIIGGRRMQDRAIRQIPMSIVAGRK